MQKEKAEANAVCDASVTRGAAMLEASHAEGRYHVECVGPDGKVKWVEEFDNLVTTEGGNALLDTGLRAQTQLTAWFVGLISSTSYTAVAIGDVAAQINGTNGWKEAAAANDPHYSQATRPALTVGNAAAAKTLTASAASAFSITSAGTVKGCFLISNSTKDGTTGKLYSAGLFTGGDKVVGIGDTLNVTYAASV